MTRRRPSASDCARSGEILEAERRGRLPDELAAHVARCPACADAVLVEQMLYEDAQVAFREALLPDAAVAWWRGSLAERRREESRALRPIAVWEWTSALAATVIALVAMPGIKGLAAGLAKQVLGGGAAGGGLGGLLIAAAVIPVLAVAGGLVWIWADS